MKVGPEVYLASQLREISSRFSAHVEDLREFLRKEKLPAPSPEAIHELSRRLEGDARFRADVGSLLRAALYRERERVGYEDLLAILVTAAAGAEHDLKNEPQERDIRDVMRFVVQSRRTTFPVDADEAGDVVEPEPKEPVLVEAVRAEPERMLVREPQGAGHSKKLELKPDEGPVAVAEAESRESGDLVLPPLRAAGLFAAPAEVAAPWWRAHPAWIAGVVCLAVGIGLGLSLHRVVSAAELHGVVRAASALVKAKPGATVASSAAASKAPVVQGGVAAAPPAGSQAAPELRDGITEAPVGTVQTASAAEHDEAPAAGPLEGRATPPAAAPVNSSGVPVTVVKQVVTASASDGAGGTQMAAATSSTVHPGAAGMTAANVIFSPAPEYPPAAAAAGVRGQVTVHAVVDPDGNVIYARAVSGPPLLRDAAKEAVEKWRYRPLLDNGKPIAVTTVAILDFRVAK